jgi:predicted ATP-grasp superfamily ATP-dependent carboligase
VMADTRTVPSRIRVNRILVTDAETRGGLAVARGLHGAGFQVTTAAAANARPAPAHWSRSVRDRLVVPAPLEDEEGFLGALVRAVRFGRYSVLVPGSDVSLLAISRGRRLLEPHVRSWLPPHELVERSLDKLVLLSAASRHGLDQPPTSVCRGKTEALSAASRIGFPLLVKPVTTILEVDGARQRVGAILARDEPTLEHAVAAYGGSCLVQRRERGAVWSFAGVFAQGRLLANVLSRYHRTCPPDAGGASFSETVRTPAWLEQRVSLLLEEIGWQGLFELELIKRADDGFAAIDLNPRPYGSLALAISAGANLPAIWCQHVLGQEPRRAWARPGVFYRCEDADLSHALWHARHRRFVAAARALTPQRGVVHSHFRARDPGPLLARLLFMAKQRWPRAGGPPACSTEPEARRGTDGVFGY